MKSIIITGATSGIGFQCAMHIARTAPGEQIIIACRDVKSGENTIQAIAHETGHPNLVCMPLDLNSLASVRNFRDQFSESSCPCIIALINNAGIQNISQTQITEEGFESTFGVNHLAPLYLTLLLMPFMDSKASITFTASGVHDPKQKTGIEHPVFKSARELAYPAEMEEKRHIAGQRRYSTSKLCNILTSYELQRRLSNKAIRVNAFDPGLVPGTGLARTYSPLMRFLWRNVFPLLRYFVHNINTAENSGKRLANLAYSEDYKESKGKYFEGAKEIRSSIDSYNEDFQHTLWKTSVELLGIKQEETSVLLA